MQVRRILREPLLHFLLLGLAVFAYYGRVAPDDDGKRRIVAGLWPRPEFRDEGLRGDLAELTRAVRALGRAAEQGRRG